MVDEDVLEHSIQSGKLIKRLFLPIQSFKDGADSKKEVRDGVKMDFQGYWGW